jgi:hypothetical protein
MKTPFLPIVPAGLLLAVLGGWSAAAPAPEAGRPKEIASFQAHRFTVQSLAFSPDGKTLASGGSDGRVKFWEVATSKNVVDFEAHFRGVRGSLGRVGGWPSVRMGRRWLRAEMIGRFGCGTCPPAKTRLPSIE